MRYIRTDKATDFAEYDKWAKALGAVFPRANPDYDKVMHLVREWLIEIDEEDLPYREVALDVNGKVILAGPDANNYGFWLDTNMKGKDLDGEPISSSEFEKHWQAFAYRKSNAT